MAAFRGFNRWLLDDWTFCYRERLFAAPYIVLMDVDSKALFQRLTGRRSCPK